MKAAAWILSAAFVLGTAMPAHAQLGGALGRLKKGVDKAADLKGKYDDMTFNDQEERQLGDLVSMKLRQHFGVYQDAAVTKYVSLVGTALSHASNRPTLDWKFIVLDTDGVNAYAAPGGFIHITRGLLGLIKSESELAGVLGHEITHVTRKHTIDAIRNGKGGAIALDQATGATGTRELRASFIGKVAEKAATHVFEGEFSQEDENEADRIGVQVANKVGYAPNGMVEVLKKIDARNGGRDNRNGMFASHPATKDRIEKLEKQIKDEKLAATAAAGARYREIIRFDAKPVSEIAVDVEGAAGLASGDKKKDDDKDKKDKDKDKKDKAKKGNLLNSITGTKQTQASQQTASAGARGGLPDRDAKGGSNPNPLGVKITAAELEAFKKGIVA